MVPLPIYTIRIDTNVMNLRKLSPLLSFVVVLAALFVVFRLWTPEETKLQGRYTVIVSIDGFRAEYFGRAHTPALNAMATEGVRAILTPMYPSNTFPNHYSMATGLHPQNHGLVNNSFWDEDLQDYYKLGDIERVHNPDFYWGEPIWNTAEKQGIKAGSYYWVGSETAIQGMHPSYWKVFDGNDSFVARADSVLAWLRKPEEERPRLITWYLQEPDAAAHHHGTQSQETLDMIAHVDSVIGYFRSELGKLPIANLVDFIVVSDHGMADLDPDKVVNLMDYLPRDSFSFVVEGAPTLLYAKSPEYVDVALEVLKTIPYITAYRTSEVPERFHYNKGGRLGDIVVMPELGASIFFRDEPRLEKKAGHGFDNQLPEMQAIFFAVGKSFAKGKEVGAVPNITIYPLLCRLQGLTPAPNDASEADVDRLLGR